MQSLCEAADIGYTSFERTTNKHHALAVNELWVNLNGIIIRFKILI
jgi:methionyl-tRNA synthetase